jgi:hypothetical protein
MLPAKFQLEALTQLVVWIEAKYLLMLSSSCIRRIQHQPLDLLLVQHGLAVPHGEPWPETSSSSSLNL